ncbi:MAG: AAA family ATPase [Pseudomonadota bacterium]
MKVCRLHIENFRGVRAGTIDFAGHTLLVGGNNVGKSSVCEALDLLLGPERLFRRPVINEHDFHQGAYLDAESNPVEIVIRALLSELSEQAEARFHSHLRRWDAASSKLIDESDAGLSLADSPDAQWVLPVVFIGRYDRKEDDFIANTFFDHPVDPVDEDADEGSELRLGAGRRVFGRDQKRDCGFLFLRTQRTGSRALSLQRGSLLDTILRIGSAGDGDSSGLTEMWEETLQALRNLSPPIGKISQLSRIRTEIEERLSRFVNLDAQSDPTAFFASNLTRENLREVVRLFVATHPAPHQLPFERLGTGSINLLVFSLLTFIADLRGGTSVIFAMEEPEIAIPPHVQRRVCKYVLDRMGQSIVTSHSPYIIEQFQPGQVLALSRSSDAELTGSYLPVDTVGGKVLRRNRWPLAEAVLSRGVLVVEGPTEAAMFVQASTVLEGATPNDYEHLDLAGVSVFSVDADNAVPDLGPFFKALGKPAFAFYDKQKTPFSSEKAEKLNDYVQQWESPYLGIESLIAAEMPIHRLRGFLSAATSYGDYPEQAGVYKAEMDDASVRALASKVLKARKGANRPYAAFAVGACQTEKELPSSIVEVLRAVHQETREAPPTNTAGGSDTSDVAASASKENPGKGST